MPDGTNDKTAASLESADPTLPAIADVDAVKAAIADDLLAADLREPTAAIVVTLRVTMTRPAYSAWTHTRAGRVVMLLATYALRLRHVQHVSIETATVDGYEIATPEGMVQLHPDAGSEQREQI